MQLELGGSAQPATPDPLPPRRELEAWRALIPDHIHFGTSTWTYPGWYGQVYHERYPERGGAGRMLAEYARFPLFTTVGIDSSFYRPPSPRTLAAWARVLPGSFRAVSKVWDRITVHTFTGKREGAAMAGRPNPDFLSPGLFLSEVLEPFRAHFGEHTGPFVLEFQTIAGPDADPDRFAEGLDAFFGLLPRTAQYAVEIRNPEFLTSTYLAVLRAHNVAHVFNSWSRMPPIGTQLDLKGTVTADFIVSRALLRPGRMYAEAVEAFKPYDRVREVNPELRGDLVRLAEVAVALRIPAYLIVNNRAEGNAPHTIAAVARQLAESLPSLGQGGAIP